MTPVHTPVHGPAIWRSEAFAEDLIADKPETAPQRRGARLALLLGVVPVVLAAASAVVAAWGGSA